MSNGKYILEGHEPKLAEDLLEWGSWFETADRIVAKTQISDDIEVSTIFLGLDHSFGEGPPLLFETMIFGGSLDQEMNRYPTWDEAEKGHQEIVQKAKESLESKEKHKKSIKGK